MHKLVSFVVWICVKCISALLVSSARSVLLAVGRNFRMGMLTGCVIYGSPHRVEQ